MQQMTLNSIDHVVFTVHDIDATCAFYARVLGMDVVTFGEGRTGLEFGQCKINLHQYHHEFEPKAAQPAPGTQDICLVTDMPIQQVVDHLRAEEIEIIQGPVPRLGARGMLDSVYFRDPDGNLVEIGRYRDTTESV